MSIAGAKETNQTAAQNARCIAIRAMGYAPVMDAVDTAMPSEPKQVNFAHFSP